MYRYKSIGKALQNRLALNNGRSAMHIRTLSSHNDNFLSGSSAVYVDQMYSSWKKDPASVHVSWQSYFANLDKGMPSASSFAAAPLPGSSAPLPKRISDGGAMSSDCLSLSYLVRAYQFRGHEIAGVNPLGLTAHRNDLLGHTIPPDELHHTYHGFTDSDMDRVLNLEGLTDGSISKVSGLIQEIANTPNITLRIVMDKLKKIYCGPVAVEYMHISSREKCNFIRDRVESKDWMHFSKEKKFHIFERLAYADGFEKFCAQKYNTAKRFGLEGGEGCIPGLKAMIDKASEMGIENCIIGMPHRGRLNVLANVVRKPLTQIFKEFDGTHYEFDEVKAEVAIGRTHSGDVKYHLGTSQDRTYPDGRKMHLALLANPSHLEAVNTVVLGKTRAKQFLIGGEKDGKDKVIPVLLHGDAAFAGQGIVYETFQLADVPDFAVGGTIHVIVNNQVGFTTDPSNARSTMYCSDLGKAFSIPVFHCNGDDPLAVVAAFEFAVEWRAKYEADIIIDVVCYRRHGHNELDLPNYTQPLMYDVIPKHPRPVEVFEKKLLESGEFTADELKVIRDKVKLCFESEYEKSKLPVPTKTSDWLESNWKGFKGPRQLARIKATGLSTKFLTDMGLKMNTIPENITMHKQLKKIIGERYASLERGTGIDWATAEALAFGSLLKEDFNVRLTGQDVERGTFSHRHAIVVDQKTGAKYCPLKNLSPETIRAATKHIAADDVQGEFTVRNSILSEYGVLGFELGYSLHNPNQLVLWEAQFGDFVNGAQIIIDQFLSSGEDKWYRQNGLVMLLPHGMAGQGAEHSSCRIERFLQQVDEDADVVPSNVDDIAKSYQVQGCNMQIVNPTTPANYYHVLRRQIHREFRKPLIIPTPKNLLRDKRCVSNIEDFGEDSKFIHVYGEQNLSIDKDKVKRLIFCSGKVYYDLAAHRDQHGFNDVAIVRIEQIAPFPFSRVADEINMYPNADIIFCQEEHKNMGSWSFVEPRIATATREWNGKERRATYVGRGPSASPATGLGMKVHEAEEAHYLHKAFAGIQENKFD